jgi:iron complex outermembrane receptor protein
MRIKNLIVARRTGDDTFVGVNAGKTTHNGMEITLNYDFLKHRVRSENNVFGFITYTLADYAFTEFLDGDNDYSGNDLTGIPRHVLNTGLSFRTKTGIYGNLNYQFVDRMPMRDDNSVYSDSYQLVNLKLGYNKSLFKKFHLDLYTILNNIFDIRYASMIMVNASSFGGNEPRYYYPGLPRNFYVGTEISYLF